MIINHTEGSWTVEKWNHPKRGEVTQVSAFSEDGNRTMCCVVESFNQAGDARLIAAAPELLKALQWILEDVASDTPEMWSAARTAIVKATG